MGGRIGRLDCGMRWVGFDGQPDVEAAGGERFDGQQEIVESSVEEIVGQRFSDH